MMEDIMSHATPTSSPTLLLNQDIPVSVNKYFHGRRESIRYIRDQLHSTLQYPSVICVHGLPGMGKTQLAAQYCKLFSKEYFACIWVVANTRTNTEDALSSYAVKIKLNGASIEAEPSRNAQLLVSWLERQVGGLWKM